MNYRQNLLYAHLDHFSKSFQLETVRLLRTELAGAQHVRYSQLRLQLPWCAEYLCDRHHCRACMTSLCVERQRLEVYRITGWVNQPHICTLWHATQAVPQVGSFGTCGLDNL